MDASADDETGVYRVCASEYDADDATFRGEWCPSRRSHAVREGVPYRRIECIAGGRGRGLKPGAFHLRGMCGRYALFSDPETLAERFGVAVEGYDPTYNAAPSQSLPVVADDDPERLRAFQWGFVPPWADDASTGPINARAETAREKPMFEGSVADRRCLVPCDGFYEWREEGGTKRPYFFRRADGDPFAMAGLWATYEPETTQTGLGDFAGGGDGGAIDREREPMHSFAILTTAAGGAVGEYHGRESVVLDAEEEAAWLDGSLALDGHENDVDYEVYPVSTAVNSPANDAPELVERV